MEYLAPFLGKANYAKKLRVWLVDDDIDLCDAYVDYLSEFFEVSAVFNESFFALNTLSKALPKEIPDVIVVDRSMTDMDGIHLSREITQMRLSVGILMVSGIENTLSRKEADDLNIFGVLQKPCSPALICDAIHDYDRFKKICEQIGAEILKLCRNSKRDWEFFLGQHADLEKAFNTPIRTKLGLSITIQEIENRIKTEKIKIPNDSSLPWLFEQFRNTLQQGEIKR